jgi:hypothetical protein
VWLVRNADERRVLRSWESSTCRITPYVDIEWLPDRRAAVSLRARPRWARAVRVTGPSAHAAMDRRALRLTRALRMLRRGPEPRAVVFKGRLIGDN